MLSPLRDFSGTITAGGTSQKAIGQREYGRNCLIIQNPPTETNTLYVAFGDSPAVLGGGAALWASPPARHCNFPLLALSRTMPSKSSALRPDRNTLCSWVGDGLVFAA